MVGESPDVDVDGSGDTCEREVDAVLGALADQRRRHVLSCLLEEDRAMGLSELARTVAEREADGPGGELDRETVSGIETSLYHVHVPKLAAVGMLEFGQDGELVRAATDADQFERAASLADGIVVSHDVP